MKYFFLCFFIGLKVCAAQTFSYPKFVKQGRTLEKLVPQNWKIIDTAYGDLNNDQTDDLAFVVEYHLPIAENRAYGDNETELIKEFQKPRVLAIYFKNPQSGNFAFALQNNNFILRAHEGGGMGDPFKNINIANQNLQLSFEGGNNWRWKLDYDFNYRNKDWSLILANNIYYHIGSGEMTEKKYNFLDRRTYLVTGNIFNRNSGNQRTEEVLYFSDLRTFDTFKKPWTWEITKDNFL
ncbi:hypothetical protein [Pedobacter insulae]|uniref:Uncharacterized protein n=1 Tax=Pedobacter insulae TaxID=414048 RepID=A0A1I2UMX5_9SPHI|nr:hypothetical protein [Pedobacter insulae]SFG78524.1 hypothetical protein SAMN04489864_102254 [Pedobacter insulae]